MNLKTYRAASIADALQQIKRDLGPDAVILHTRTFKRGGWLGIGGRTLVEITASTSVNVVHPLARKGKAPSEPIIRPGADFVRRAYGADANASPKPAAAALAADASLNEPPIDEFTSTATALLEPDAAEKPAEKFEPKPEPSRNPAAPEPPKIRTTTPAIREASRLAETVAVPGDAGVTLTLKDDLAAIKKMVGQMLQRSSGPAQPVMPDALFQQYLRMIESEVSTEIADRIVAAVRDELHAQELADETVVKQAVLRRLEDHIPVCADTARPGRMPDGRPLTIALVGPTGVGKTTTIAKLAATYKLRHGRKVGLVTSDTYRIAAVDQLRTYANIIGLPLQVALTPKEMTACCESLFDCDVVLIDTAGRSQHDGQRLDELQTFLTAARPHETHLVLSSVCGQAAIMRTAERFSVVKPNRVIFTKLDEAVSFGVLVNAAQSIDARLSFVTTGQEVPDHLEPGRADRLARLVLEGSLVRK